MPWSKKYNWFVICLLAFFLVSLGVFEYIKTNDPVNGTFQVREVVVHFFFMIATGILLITSLRHQEHTTEVLRYKHKHSLDMAQHEDWNVLIAQFGKLSEDLEFSVIDSWKKFGTIVPS